MSEVLVLGDEAVALGAVDAGISIAYGYPGTPSTEIIEYLQHYSKNHDNELITQWCSNEKTSTEGAVGVSYAGKRCLVTMKHVGLNVAMDAFINACLLKINGGLVLAVADDPGMHSSQNEQDTRYLTDFAHTMCLEPRNHQEAYEMTKEAFEISEKFHIPVVIRLVTRLSHSRAVIQRGETKAKTDLGKGENRFDWMTLPSTSRKMWAELLEQQKDFTQYSEDSEHNPLTLNPDFTEYGVITSGLGGNYYLENAEELDSKPSHLHVSVYPVPVEKIRKLASSVKRLVLIEEGYPYIEKQLVSLIGQSMVVNGKLDGTVPNAGELNPDNVRPALGLAPRAAQAMSDVELPGRPPQLCAGCPHTDSFNALNEARKSFDSSIVTSDIGCYALGALPPHNAVETILCMGASVGMAKGAAEAGQPNVVATIGDSTFLHSGITGLVDAVAANTNMTLVILDNSTTAMTGGQDTVLSSTQIKDVVLGCGVDPAHVVEMNPLPKHHAENVEIFKKEIAYKGLSVVIPLRECIQTLKTKMAKARK